MVIKVKRKIREFWEKLDFKYIFLFLIIIFIIVVFSKVEFEIRHLVNNNTSKMLEDIHDESLNNISIKVEDSFAKMEAMASFIGQYEDIQCEEVMNALSSQITDVTLPLSGVIKLDGSGITSDGQEFQADYEDFCFEEALSGERSNSGVLHNEQQGIDYIILAVPIKCEDRIAGVLQCAYDIKVFTDIIDKTTISTKGTTFIAQSDGTLVSRPAAIGQYTNMYNIIDKFGGDKSKINKFKNQIKNKESGIATFNSGKYKKYVCYSSIPSTDWYSITIVSANVVENVTNRINDLALMMSTAITLVFMLYIAYWFAKNYFINKKMHMKEQRYHIVANQSDSIVFEYNVKNKTAYHTHKWEEKFGYPPIAENYLENMVNHKVVYEKDKDKFLNIFKSLQEDGIDYSEDFIKIYNSEGDTIECKIRATAIRNKRNRVVRVVGKILELKDFTKPM